MRRTLVVVAALAGCTDQQFVVVTVSERPAVHGATALIVQAGNAGAKRSDTLTIGMHQFPVTFSVAAPGRTGTLDLQVQAQDANQNLVGIGSTSVAIGTKTAAVLLDPADFVVNTDVAGDHFLSDDFEANGFQLGATSDGNWTVGFRDDCPTSSCNLFARRFDKTGLPLTSTLAAGTNAFPITTTTTTSIAEPAIAVAGQTSLVVWDFADTADTSTGIACRALDGNGNAAANQLTISSDNAQVVSATPLSTGNFALTWSVLTSTNPEQIRSAIVQPNCSLLAGSLQTTSLPSTTNASRSHVAANQTAVLFGWIQDAFSAGDIHLRVANTAGTFPGNDVTFVTHTATDEVDHVRLAPFGGGFAIVARWGAISGTGPGQIVLYRAAVAGANVTMIGTPTLITDQSASDFSSDKSFGVAVRADGALLVTWHVCANPDGSQCNVYARIVRPTGAPVGDSFVVATAQPGYQTNPATTALTDSFAVAWHDTSTQVAGKVGEVRARIVYPPYDDAIGVLGAPCSATAPCGMGLSCGPGSDAAMRCYEQCDPNGTPPLCPHGGTCSPATGGSACAF
jgi:hypothetical protein